jgi:tRNA wybutosine-synthesizing protein 1
MLSETDIQRMEKQKYRVVGDHKHSAVKVCGWTKKMLKGEGGCYKLKFYGIMSHQCMQMTTSISCANRCSFCWRDYKAPVAKEWKWQADEPDQIIEQSLKAHHSLLIGNKGNPKVSLAAYKSSESVKHVALSLTGEPIMYPKLNELVTKFHKQGVSTFLVTNAQYPEQVKDLKPITQLYISIDAPNKTLLKEIDVPLFPDFWERLNKSLEYMSQKKARTCVRLTCIKEMNMSDLPGYATLIQKGDPDFIEIKGYMFVGASRQRLDKANMPFHEDVVSFSKAMLKYIPEYDIVSEHIPSRVVMLAKKKFKIDGIWKTWIDFPKFHKLSNEGKEINAMDYSIKTPKTGLSGKGTVENMIKVNEKTDELEFWEEEIKAVDQGC